MLKIAVCDDEPFMVQALSQRLTDYFAGRQSAPWQISSFTDGQSLLACGDRFDLIFLDIQMPPPNGMETARELRRRGGCGLLIFVTVLQERVFDAFEVQAYDYLIKPLDDSRFRRIMDRAVDALERQTDPSLLIQKGGAWEKIALSAIIYCEVLGRKLYLHQTGGAVSDCYERLEALERRLDGRFFKCHRSYLVNLDHVRGCQGGQVLLSQGERIPVSRLREREFMEALLRRMKGKAL